MAKRRQTEFGWVREEAKTYEAGQHQYRPLSENEEKQRQLMLMAALDIAKKVGLLYGEEAYLTPEQLDLAWVRVDPAPDNPVEELFAAYLFGFPLGEYLVQRCGMSWCSFTDAEGTSLAVHHERAEVTAFPIASVQKRLMPNDPPFFKAVVATVVQQISASLAARNEMEAEEAAGAGAGRGSGE